MRLTRRDALAALAAGGAAAAGGAMLSDGEAPDPAQGDLPDATVDALVAASEVLYPSTVEGHREFVETYALSRVAADADHRAGLAATVERLDEVAREWFDGPVRALSPDERDALLRQLGADTADPAPGGTFAERVRYYVVNDLLYAFYASPTGGELVGTENPVGYPGGYRTALSEEYRRAEPGDGTARFGSGDADGPDSGSTGDATRGDSSDRSGGDDA